MQTIFNFLYKYLVIIASLLVLFPFVVISYYNNPTSDDYCLALDVSKFGYIGAQTHWYENWGGRYASIAMVCLPILESHNLYLYKLFPIVLMLSMFVAIFYLSREVFRNNNFSFHIQISLVLLVAYIVSMPLISEGFYWWSGAMTYQLANVLSLVLLRYIFKLLRTNSILATFFSCVLVFCIVGCNEISMLFVDLFLLGCLLINSYDQKKIHWKLLIVLGVAVACSSMVYFSPGHFIRQSMFPGNERFFYSIIMALAQFLFSVFSWLGVSFIIAVFIFSQLKNKIRKSFFPLSVIKSIVVLSSFMVCSFFIGFWATGQPLAPRAQNVIYLFFLLGAIYCFLNYFNKLSIAYQEYKINTKIKVVLLMGFYSILFGQLNVKNIFTDLIKGKAKKYNAELVIRKQLTLEAETNSELVLNPIKNIPKTIFVNDLQLDETHYYNSCYSQYWKLKSVNASCD